MLCLIVDSGNNSSYRFTQTFFDGIDERLSQLFIVWRVREIVVTSGRVMQDKYATAFEAPLIIKEELTLSRGQLRRGRTGTGRRGVIMGCRVGVHNHVAGRFSEGICASGSFMCGPHN